MGNKYYASHGLLSRMSRLGQEESAHAMLKAKGEGSFYSPTAEKRSSRKLIGF
jgi:hypothetical protein